MEQRARLALDRRGDATEGLPHSANLQSMRKAQLEPGNAPHEARTAPERQGQREAPLRVVDVAEQLAEPSQAVARGLGVDVDRSRHLGWASRVVDPGAERLEQALARKLGLVVEGSQLVSRVVREEPVVVVDDQRRQVVGGVGWGA